MAAKTALKIADRFVAVTRVACDECGESTRMRAVAADKNGRPTGYAFPLCTCCFAEGK